jgi:hypothetical protein
MYDLQTFDQPGIDFVALGHIHKHQALSYASPQVVYSGSIDRVDFGEQNEEKGWVYAEIPEKGKAEWEFRKVSARPFLTIEATVESDNATEDVVRAIARQADKLENAVVRVRIDVPPERIGELNDDDIRAQLKSAYYVAPFERTSRQRPRSRWGAAGAAIQRAGPIEALGLYLQHQKVDAERRATLVRYAQTLMSEDPEEAAAAAAPFALKEADSRGAEADEAASVENTAPPFARTNTADPPPPPLARAALDSIAEPTRAPAEGHEVAATRGTAPTALGGVGPITGAPVRENVAETVDGPPQSFGSTRPDSIGQRVPGRVEGAGLAGTWNAPDSVLSPQSSVLKNTRPP